MSIAPKGKREYKVYLNEENAEYVKSFILCTRQKGGFSALVDNYVSIMAKTLKLSGYTPAERISAKTLLKIIKNGLAQEPL